MKHKIGFVDEFKKEKNEVIEKFENILATHGDFFRNLKFYHLTDDYLFVHAGIDPRYPLEEQSEVDLVYIRSAVVIAL